MNCVFQLNMRLEAPLGPVDVLVIAGEHSGDAHAAAAVQKLKAREPQLKVCALGGPQLSACGAKMLCDMMPYAVVGFWEVLKHYRFFKKLLDEVVQWIDLYRPKRVLLVDYPGFNLLLARYLHARGISVKGGGDVEVLYYISPQIWAWKAKRRFKMARYLDRLAVLFPFELAAYADTDLPVAYTGHPFVETDYMPAVHYDASGPLLLLPGSRRAAVRRILPTLLKSWLKMPTRRPAAILCPDETILAEGRSLAKRYGVEQRVKFAMTQQGSVGASAVLMSAGTISLHCALAGMPGLIVYRAHPATYWLARWLVKVRYLGIASILLNETVYPEYIQYAARPECLAAELENIYVHLDAYREKQLAWARKIKNVLVSQKTNFCDWFFAKT